MTTQLTLFDIPCGDFVTPQAEVNSNLKWCYSRRNVLEQCLRRYYYQYYRASKRVAKAEPNKEKLQLLKNLKNRYIRAEEILLLIIRTYFKQKHKGNEMSSHLWS